MSHHRTLDPEEADFFYVPIMSTCWFFPVSGERGWCIPDWRRCSSGISPHGLRWRRAGAASAG
jgi:hypothetical protein